MHRATRAWMDAMTPPRWTHRRRLLVAALVLSLVFVTLTARRTAMDVFFRHPQSLPDSAVAVVDSLAPSIIAWRIDPETDRTGTIDITPPPPPPPAPAPSREDTATVRPETPVPDTTAELDLDDLLEQDAGPRTGPAPTRPASVPPRPVEITWPETRKLKQCIGASVTVRIHVSDAGRVLDAQTVPADVLPACIDAALAAARRIRFEPGRQGGVPVSMWTEVRIDFQPRN